MRSLTPILALTALFFVGGELQAQATPASDVENELQALVAAPATADRDREVVREFLERADVGEAVSARGVDVERLKAGLNTLPADVVADLASQVQEATDGEDLVGGNTIVISATTVIIILLILILVT